MRIGRTGASFRVILHAKRRNIEKRYALRGAVIEIHMRKLDAAELLIVNDRSDLSLAPKTQVIHMIGVASGKFWNKLA